MPSTPPNVRTRRILSLWFPRLAAERALRLEPALTEAPLVVVSETGNLRSVAALTEAAEARGLHRNQPLERGGHALPRPRHPARRRTRVRPRS
jgi:protein ImuB